MAVKDIAKSLKYWKLFFVPEIDIRIVVMTALIVSGLLFAQTLEEVLIDVCNDIMDMIPPLAFLLLAIAAVTYALGGVMSAEMRARTHVWAQSLLVGAIVGGIIYIVMPQVLGALIKAGVEDVSSIYDELCRNGTTGTCHEQICRALSP